MTENATRETLRIFWGLIEKVKVKTEKSIATERKIGSTVWKLDPRSGIQKANPPPVGPTVHLAANTRDK